MRTVLLFLSATLILTGCKNSQEEKKFQEDLNKFEEIRKKFHEIRLPTDNRPQAYGFYSKGCLDGGVSLPISGDGYQVLRVSRRRYYGHPELIKFIETLGKEIHTLKFGNVLVGDMAMPRGGPMYYGHLSHQNGLDVDFAYERITDKEKEKMTIHDFDTMEDASVMNEELTALDPEEWYDTHITVLRIVAEFKEVDRIFVNPLIVLEVCKRWDELRNIEQEETVDGPRKKNEKSQIEKKKKQAKKKSEKEEDVPWIYKIRPWYGHHDHYHVRLKCPKRNPFCAPHKKLEDNICESGELEEKWLTDDYAAREKAYFRHQAKKKDGEDLMTELPDKCQAVLDVKDEVLRKKSSIQQKRKRRKNVLRKEAL